MTSDAGGVAEYLAVLNRRLSRFPRRSPSPQSEVIHRAVFDWDVWPWLVVDGAGGELAVQMYRMDRSMRRAMRQIGEKLVPAFKRIQVTAQQATAAFARSVEADAIAREMTDKHKDT